MITTLNNKLDFLSYAQSGKFVIYGAGQVGITLLRYLATKDLIDNVLCFAVSYATRESEEIMGVPMYGVMALPTNSRVLVAVHPKLHDEIINTLTEHDITDITGISWDCYLQMRRLIPDFSTEHFLRQKHLQTILKKMKNILENMEKNTETILINTGNIICQPETIAINTIAFGKYENAFQERDVVVLGTGPSLNRYKPINGAIHIGVNRAYKFDKVKLQYLFVQDFNKGILDIYGEGYLESYINDLKKLNCKKFIGHLDDYSTWIYNLPQKDYIGTDFIRYIHGSTIHRDIRFYPTFNPGSVIISAIQFALFAHPKRIYIVGCDGMKENSSPYFDLSIDIPKCKFDASNHYNYLKRGWERVKEFAEAHYPDIEIISINPGFLKGLFKDMEM